ncbi:hypothetical protein DC366_03520 [Pelagivirga sediminicola]|uniref:SH3b domain-containing protein n=1 Tax=Pelagivirga sediminicola TaxID=2170575 RepID=A0A2T7GC53_9RHOB|nr:hypothetical protein [Pelagivirga sediminicola]PVA11999.1 hypothetical protein DC366_03520 [Pelagivirga sediminicola]
MRRAIRTLLTGLAWALAASAAQAEIDGHGPDAWRVTGVAADDVLNMRMGPGTDYLVVDHLAPDARGLSLVTCVPLLIPSIYHRLSDAQRAGLPQRWCLMRSADLQKAGWVAQRFLMEDVAQAGMPSVLPGGDIVLEQIGDPLIDGAAALVRDLYVAFEGAGGQGGNPFAAGNARRYFFADIVEELRGRGADVLYDAQDFQGAVTRIAPDPDRPMLRGMITVNVDFHNFGRTQRAIYSLRADTSQPGAPIRIFRIEHGDHSIP